MYELDNIVAHIIAAEESSRSTAVEQKARAIYKTVKLDIPVQTVTGTLTIAHVSGIGRLREAYIELSSGDAVVVLMVDGTNIVPGHSNLNDLLTISPYLSYLDCMIPDSTYVVKVSGISFVDWFKLYVKTFTPTTIKAVVLYDILVAGSEGRNTR